MEGTGEADRRRIQRPVRRWIGRATLRAEDLAEIETALHVAGLDVQWQVNGYEYGGLTAMRQHEHGPLIELEVCGVRHGTVLFGFMTNTRGATVYVHDADSIGLLGLLGATAEIVARRQNFLQRLTDFERLFCMQAAVLIGSAALAWLIVVASGRSIPSTAVIHPVESLGVGLVLAVVTSVVAYFDLATGRISGRMRVFLHQDEEQSWLADHAHVILAAVFAAIAGSIVTVLVTRLLTG